MFCLNFDDLQQYETHKEFNCHQFNAVHTIATLHCSEDVAMRVHGGGNFFREAIEFLVNEALYIQLLVLIITSPIMVNERLAVSMSNWVSLAWKS
jgi:hypothetical protein